MKVTFEEAWNNTHNLHLMPAGGGVGRYKATCTSMKEMIYLVVDTVTIDYEKTEICRAFRNYDDAKANARKRITDALQMWRGSYELVPSDSEKAETTTGIIYEIDENDCTLDLFLNGNADQFSQYIYTKQIELL